MEKEHRIKISRIVISALFLIILFIFKPKGIFAPLLYSLPYLIVGYDVIFEAVEGIIHFELFDECFLMTLATLGAFIIGEYQESVFVMLFYQTGELFQDIAVGKSKKNITELMDIRPDIAHIKDKNGTITEVKPESVKKGETIVVRPGEKVPLDGIITKGESAVDSSSLTGESVPFFAVKGSHVYSGSIVLSGVIEVQTEKIYEDSTVSKIIKLAEKASEKKTVTEKFITSFAKKYTPCVCIAAICLAFIPPIFNLCRSLDPMFRVWLYRALTFLVISCPCALVISIPLTFFAGIGGASRNGILVKGSDCFEKLSKADRIAFDKTGTLTEGIFKVTDVRSVEFEKEKLKEYAAYAEAYSEHPVGVGIKEYYGKNIDLSKIGKYKEYAGKGVLAEKAGDVILAGSKNFLEEQGVRLPEKDCTDTVSDTSVYIAVNGKFAGILFLGDKLKEEAPECIRMLAKEGINKTVMLTGDNEKAAAIIAEKAGIKEYRAGLLPDMKADELEKIKNSEKGKIIFAGDGINDAPVIALSDVGIAMGGLGSDAALEAADAVIMNDDLVKIPILISFSKRVMKIARQNIVFALAFKIICLILSAFGLVNMWLSVFADVGVMIIAVLNAIRALHFVKK